MIELKAYNVVATADVNPEVVDNLRCTEWPAYDKEEADKVIAEKDKEIAELKEQIEVLKNQACKMNCMMVKHYNEVCDDNIHHKYKRCLAMALVWFERAENSTDWKNELVSRKRFSKWMELAEKFKEVK